jgi:tetratricopeptide (TPR) repeat protein
MLATPDGILHLVAELPYRQPADILPARLHPLFERLGTAPGETERIEDDIWQIWMYHPNQAAARLLDKAVSNIAAGLLDIAETRLVQLVRSCPDYAEAWNKLATVYYLRGWDPRCIEAIARTLELEPRHFGALCELGEIYLSSGRPDEAATAFRAALRIHPAYHSARARLHEIGGGAGAGADAPDPPSG